MCGNLQKKEHRKSIKTLTVYFHFSIFLEVADHIFEEKQETHMSSKELDFFTARIMEPERSRICSSRTKEIRCIRCQPIHPMNIPISMNYPHYSPFYKTLISKPDFWSPGLLIFGEGTNLVANDITTLGVHLLDYTTGSYGPGLTSCWKLDGKWEKLDGYIMPTMLMANAQDDQRLQVPSCFDSWSTASWQREASGGLVWWSGLADVPEWQYHATNEALSAVRMILWQRTEQSAATLD